MMHGQQSVKIVDLVGFITMKFSHTIKHQCTAVSAIRIYRFLVCRIQTVIFNNTLFVSFSQTYFNLCLMMDFIYAETCSRIDNKILCLGSCLSNLSRKLATIRL